MTIKNKYLLLTIFGIVLSFPHEAMSQTDVSQQKQSDNSVLGQYRREKNTVEYKVDRKVAKQRRVSNRKGNKELKNKNNSNAINNYRNALKADSNYAKAQYNKALVHSQIGQNDSALNHYKKVCMNNSATPAQRADAHFNAGNIHLRKALAARDTGGYDGQSLKDAIEEYKASLRLNSSNNDVKHNLSLAKQLLRPEQQNGGGGQNQQNQDQQNQQDQKDQQNQQNQQDKQNQDQQNKQQQQDQQQDKKEGKKQEQNRREAEQMLNAMKNNEQQTRKAVRMKEAAKERRQGTPTKIEKDW